MPRSAGTTTARPARAEPWPHAVGSYNGTFGIAEHWDGGRWTIQWLPVPPAPPGWEPLVLPASVSCTPAACMTVGSTQNQTLAERRDGGRWIIEPTPNPS